jgi:hypothetical protein
MANEETPKINKPQRIFLVLLLAFAPVLASSLAFAETRAEHDATVAAAQAKLSAAQEALRQAQDAYSVALNAGVSLDSQIVEAEKNLRSAQAAYDQSQILDPSWVRPIKEETYTVSVAHTVQVPYTVIEQRTSEVTRTIQVPNVSTVSTTSLVPREITTVVPSGLTAKVYNMQGYNNAPPLPTENRLMFTTTVSNIDFNWGGNRVMDSGPYEDVVVNFAGSIYIPENGNYGFYAPGDDGVQVIIDGNRIINDWYDKGGGGSMVYVALTSGSHNITVWYYENGGGANVWLYWAKPGMGWEIVPASAFGEQTIKTTVYDEVTTISEVVTYTEETVTETIVIDVEVTLYRDEEEFREEERVRIVPDEDAEHPKIKDPELLPAISDAQSNLSNLNTFKNQNAGIIEAASADVSTKQQELNVAQQELEAIPPFREPTPTPTETESPSEEPAEPQPEPLPEPEQTETPEPKPEPELRVNEAVSEIEDLAETAPEDLTDAQVERLIEAAMFVFETAEQGSPAYEQALEALSIAAEADDPELPSELAAIPGAAVVLEVFNNLGNVGADMSPQIREEAEKTVIASVIATGAAVQATVAAATAAAATTSSSGSSGGGSGASGSGSGGGTNRKVK